MLVIVAPGQGAQTPGFLSSWLEIPEFRDRISAWSQIVELDLIEYGTKADAERIRDTAVAQPLLVAAALASFELLNVRPDIVAGHSVGELAAAAIAGVITPEEALALVRERGRAMAEAAAVTKTGMVAVLGGDEAEVLAAIEKHGLTPANINGAGQIVAGGTVEQLEALKAEPPKRARLIPLSVAGAFHTVHMAPAVERLAKAVADLSPSDPPVTLLSNRDGAAVSSGKEFLDRLVSQVADPVRWDKCMATMAERGVTTMIELLPGGTLTGLARRGLPGVRTVAIKTPADLEAAREVLA
ncbi:ACP S-malonyltransferase [Thermobispora bispora]|uniref:ACP S-malonyltransferase n=1 Tax=Thermobispora bispora TaxID=2006 RepID=UPI000682C2E9|nr:ACP S-malonyltransferase [Thermobispora bispora]MBO2474369.1 ACP S-malonyltransferase [Actinomycetales bacterium]MBX6167740.1 ACP S-malonyltransferase [Thermobispora bispora]QSI48795.1 ACP S-malonyltransferase [Thermobispora bispora]